MENNQKKFKVLITASGLSPVGFNTIFSLKEKVQKIVGVDVNSESYAKELCDGYYKIPYASDERYISKIMSICSQEGIDTILPLTIEEAYILKQNERQFNKNNIFIANSNSIKSIEICNDKLLTINYLNKVGINVPKTFSITNNNDLKKAAVSLEYPQKVFVFKPRITHGSRGFRIITKSYNKLNLLLNDKPTDNILLNLEELLDIIGSNEIKAVAMDYLEGDDYSVYSFAINGQSLVTIPMKRSGLIPGMSTGGEIVKNKSVTNYVSDIISALKLNGSINIQLKVTKQGPLLYEINSRLSATMVITRAFNLNFPYYEILLAHGAIDEIKKEVLTANMKWGIKMNRIQQEVYNDNGKYYVL